MKRSSNALRTTRAAANDLARLVRTATKTNRYMILTHKDITTTITRIRKIAAVRTNVIKMRMKITKTMRKLTMMQLQQRGDIAARTKMMMKIMSFDELSLISSPCSVIN
jgi:hypothetical protein